MLKKLNKGKKICQTIILKKMPNKKEPENNDWLAAGILGLMLFLAIAGSPTMKNQTEKSDTTKNIKKSDVIINTPDTQHVEQGASLFDTTFLFIKRMYENNR